MHGSGMNINNRDHVEPGPVRPLAPAEQLSTPSSEQSVYVALLPCPAHFAHQFLLEPWVFGIFLQFALRRFVWRATVDLCFEKQGCFSSILMNLMPFLACRHFVCSLHVDLSILAPSKLSSIKTSSAFSA